MVYLWVAVVILLAIVEAMTINIVTIWYVASGLVTIGVSFFTDNFMIQLGVFVVLGTILLITTRPILKKIFDQKSVRTNLDRVIGMEGVVTEEILKNQIGEVKVDGKKWSAISAKKLSVGSKVEILSIDGVKLKVREIKEED